MAETSIVWRGRVRDRLCRAILLLAGAFILFAGVLKAEDAREFQETIVRHEMLSPSVAGALSLLVPWLEIILGAGGIIAALSSLAVRPFAFAAGTMFLSFSVYALLLSFDPPASPVPCGCLASAKPVESWFGVAALNGAVATLMCVCANASRVGTVSTSVPTR